MFSLLIGLLPHGIKLLSYPDYPGFDDAFIHLRVADNLTHGKGWAVNPLEPINVSSSPLFTLLLSVGFLLGVSPVAYGMALSAVATSAAIAVIWFLARPLVSGAWFAALPATLFAANVHLWRWNATIMEPTLACLALGAALLVFEWARAGRPRRFMMFGALVSVACLVRFELGLLLPWCGARAPDIGHSC